MIRKHNITATLALAAFLTACSSEETTPTYTVGEADNAIVLRAGITEGGAGVATRAAEDHHTTPGHLNFISGTGLALQVRGTWTGKNAENKVTQTTTGTTGAKTGTDNLHNEVSMNPQLYWDDYGTADPGNTAGRTEGLTIYGAAVNGEDAPTVANDKWNGGLAWNVGTPTTGVINQNTTDFWKKQDLLTSNNVTAETGQDGTYKFDERNSGKLLEFTHAMTKVTVNLKAGEGFPGWSTSTPDGGAFQTAPTVTLLGFNYTGTVNIIGKESTPTAATTNITAHLADGGAAHTATYDALVFPGNKFADTDEILKINADGNEYFVTAKLINDANTATDDEFEQAKNYVLNITVNKTKIETITATIVNWSDVKAATETPKINISANYGQEMTDANAFKHDFDFYRSETINANYSKDAIVTYSVVDSKNTYTLSTPLYWPTHNTHYFFRGVFPTGVTVTDNSVIAVTNTAYTAESNPSDLAIGFPRPTIDNESCGNSTHNKKWYEDGICATEGEIRMNFQYVMSQVEVRLTTNTADGATDAVNLANAKVEIVNGYTAGNINLSDGSATPTGDKDDYTLNPITGADRDGVAAANIRHSAVLPQALTYTTAGATTNLRFKITIYNSSDPDDVDIYYADINPILEKGKSTKVAPNGKWEAGVHYIYNLDIRKTAIKVTATLTDWITVTASDNVWF